ncbi:Protein C07D8.6 [Aphelenchoides avenae]|nr:Protein C07D8.6 [Aphelenchus avenae]
MPVLGLGTYQSKPPYIESAIKAAITAGYRHIDTAYVYDNEEFVGDALQKLFDNDTIKREDLFLPPSRYRTEDVEPTLREQLKRLKLDYVDLYLIHFPTAKKGMEGVYEKGLTKAIGISNFNSTQIKRLLKTAKVPMHVLQVEAHVHMEQRELDELCKENNITFTAYAPLGNPGLPSHLYPKNYTYPWPPGPKPLLNREVLKLAGKYGKPPASILLRYLIQRGFVTIPKSISPERIYENIQIFDFELSEEEMQTLRAIRPQHRVYTQDWFAGHPEDPFVSERM